MPKALELEGLRYGKLTVIKRVENEENTGKSMFLCHCDCGNKHYTARGSHLKNGAIISCGCVLIEKAKKRAGRHFLSKDRIHKLWTSISERGEEWQTFENFYTWSMENGYSEEKRVRRFDKNRPFEPSNCYWGEKNKKRSTGKTITYNGVTKNHAGWTKHFGVTNKVIKKYEEMGKIQEVFDQWSKGIKWIQKSSLK